MAVPVQSTVPSGGVYFITETGQHGIYYDFRGARFVYYLDATTMASTAGLGTPRRVSSSSLRSANRAPVQELWGIAASAPGRTFQQHGESMLLILLGGNQQAMSDPSVVGLAMQLASGQIGEQEYEVRLHQTGYWQAQSNIQREWASLSAAEQRQRIEQTAAELMDLWFRNVGAAIQITDSRIQNAAQAIASGTMTRGGWLETVVKPEALKNPESPWARTLRDEFENQLQRGIDVENKALEVRQLYDRWGLPLSDTTAQEWAKKIITNNASDADLLTHLQQQASILYPWKDPNVDTMTAAEPWLQTYARILELPVPSLTDSTIQKALTGTGGVAMPIYAFEQELKMRPEWLKTKNAMQSMTEAASQVGRMMGFV